MYVLAFTNIECIDFISKYHSYLHKSRFLLTGTLYNTVFLLGNIWFAIKK